MEDCCLFGLIPLEVSFEGHVDVVLVVDVHVSIDVDVGAALDLPRLAHARAEWRSHA